jgi:hypothetical protein
VQQRPRCQPGVQHDGQTATRIGADPVGHPRFTVTVTVLQPFSPARDHPCFATDSLGAVSNTATITISVIDPG